MDIDIAWINTVVRDRLNRDAEPDDFDHLVAGLTPDEEPAGMDLQKRVFGNVGALARAGSLAPGLANALADSGPARRVLDRFVGIDRRRDLPRLADETFLEWVADRESSPVREPCGARSTGKQPREAGEEVVLYPDVYTTYFAPERGRAAVRLLEALDVSVRVPRLPESGRAPLSQGMVETAREHAREVYAGLAEHIDAGRDVVVVEPSDLAMLRDDYAKLLPERSAERVREHSYEVLEYVYGRLEAGADADALPAAGEDDRPTDLAYHSHCQQRTLGLEGYTTAVLADRGYDVVTSDVECCGMAGSFGYKSEYYELAMDVGERLQDDLPAEARRLVASGTSCGEQLAALFDRDVAHPVEVLDPGAGD